MIQNFSRSKIGKVIERIFYFGLGIVSAIVIIGALYEVFYMDRSIADLASAKGISPTIYILLFTLSTITIIASSIAYYSKYKLYGFAVIPFCLSLNKLVTSPNPQSSMTPYTVYMIIGLISVGTWIYSNFISKGKPGQSQEVLPPESHSAKHQ